MKSLIKAIILLLVLAIILTITPSCSKKESIPYKIGLVLPLTGQSSALGNWFKTGYEFAIEEVNSKGGIKGKKLLGIFEDGAGDPNKSVSAFQKLINVEKIKIGASTLSPICLALIPIATKQKILFFANAAHPKITGQSKLIFRHSNTVAQESKLIYDFSIKNLKSQKIVICYVNDDFGLAFRDEMLSLFKSSNQKIESLEFEKTENDFRAHVIKIISIKPDIVYILGFVKNMGILIKRLRELGYKGKIFVNFGFTQPDVISYAGNAAKGVYYIDYGFDYTKEELKSLNLNYKNKYGINMPPVAILSYNVIKILKEALENVGENPESLADFIHKKKYMVIGGAKLEITTMGDILPPLEVKVYE